MARQPEHIIPFEPFASGRQLTKKPVYTDDRRDWFSSVPGLVFSNEVLVQGTGAAPISQSLTEALVLKLPRPEPVTLSFHPWYTDDLQRHRLMAHLFAEVEDDTVAAIQAKWGRVYVEWGTGQSRGWTHLDAGPGSLQLPSVSEVRVYGWSYSTSFILSVNAQIGYASADLTATWSFYCQNAAATVNTKSLPNFARLLTAYGGWLNSVYDLNDLADLAITDPFGTAMANWSIRPPLAPNPSQRPYPCVAVPLSGAARNMVIRITNNVGNMRVVGVVTVKI